MYFFYCNTQDNYRLFLWKEDHLFWMLHDTTVCSTLLHRGRSNCLGSHGLWPLRGHLQASSLFFHHDQRLCAVLVLVSGAGGFLHSIIQIIFTLQLPLCGTNIIDHYMCDLFPLLKLACTDTHIFVLLVFANSGAICVIIFSLLLVSYGVILFSLRAHSSEGRYKALSICGFHITVVFLFFVPCILIYARPTSELSFEKNILIFVNVLTPLLNPMVYTFRNKEMMNAIRKMWKTFTVVSDKF